MCNSLKVLEIVIPFSDSECSLSGTESIASGYNIGDVKKLSNISNDLLEDRLHDTVKWYVEETSSIDPSPSVPTLYNEWLNSGKDKDTEELLDQIMTYSPQKREIDVDSVNFSTIS